MAHPMPLPAATLIPVRRDPANLAHLISGATALPHLKQLQVQILRNSHHNHHIFQLLLRSLPFPSYALSLLSFIPADTPPPRQLPSKILKHFSHSDNPHEALVFFLEMQNKFFPLDNFCFPPLLKAASRSLSLSEGKIIHGLAAKFGYESDPFVQTALLGMYAACGLLSEARLVFDKMPERDVVTWNIMIDGYCQSRLFDEVFALLEEMNSSDIKPDARMYTSIISACSRVGNLDVGKLMQQYIYESNVVIDFHLQTALLNMYTSFGAMDLAQSLYDEMKAKDVVVSTAMIMGYSKVSNLEAARLIFDETVDKDLVCWSAMISGYANSDKPQEALKLFHEMQRYGMRPDQVTMLSVISACARLGALDKAKDIHLYVEEKGFGRALSINNALIDMYAKCGSLDRAREVYGRLHRKNVISWTSMINAFATHGDVHNALRHFEQMKLKNVEPNWITFVGVLYACSHAGSVEEGERLFDSMVKEYGIAPRLEHYGCMVDLYGRANRLKEALELVESMPMAPNVVVWGSLMAACCIHGESKLGEFAAKCILEIDPEHDGAHVFLSNIYAKEKRWENVGVLRNSMKRKGISKERGSSMIEMDDDIHTFLTADKSHKRTNEIYAKLDEVVAKLREIGYTPNTNCLLVDLSEIEKGEVILWHSEKLAFCYGLICKEKKQSSIRIIKNLRICEDCHNFMKLASKVFDREIIIRDRTRFHHCRDGTCSCNDYW